MKDIGLTYYEILKRVANGDKEIYKLYNIEFMISPFCDEIDMNKGEFIFKANKIIEPDNISFKYGSRINKQFILAHKLADTTKKKKIEPLGSTIIISSIFMQHFCDDIKFTYNNGRDKSDVDKVFEQHMVKKVECVDDVEIKNNRISLKLYNMLLVTKIFDENKEVDEYICDMFQRLM